MFLLFFVCLYFVTAFGDLRRVSLPVYTPPSQEEILSTYFANPSHTEVNRTKKSIVNTSDKFQKTVEAMKKELSTNISNLQKELIAKNLTVDAVNVSDSEKDFVRTGVVKNFLTVPIEPTTYRYPTAIWSSQNYEKLKNIQRFHPRNPKVHSVRPTVNPAYVYLDRGVSFASPEKTQRRSRGKTKWKDSNKSLESGNSVPTADKEVIKDSKAEFVDRFLEQSLTNYLISSNLRENVGNVSVKTFSDILKNITDQKPKRLSSPYDENKELRMKFREEVILKKKNETKAHGKFLEKQLQKRLEKVQDVFNERDKDKILANMWKYTTLNRTTEAFEDKKNKTPTGISEESFGNVTSTPEALTTEDKAPDSYNVSLIYITTENPQVDFKYSTENIRGTAKFHWLRRETTETSKQYDYEPAEHKEGKGPNRNLFKLRAEESAYYRRGHFPSLTFLGQPEKPGVIPGRPLIDYPVHSFPPATRFKCPKFKEGKPRMMADPETRCQVFYICTGDGPTTAMLCPNGTMFNENFLVCDWWYNVNC